MRSSNIRSAVLGAGLITTALLVAGCPVEPPAICELGECAAGALVNPDGGGLDGTLPDATGGERDGGDAAPDGPIDGPIVPPGCGKTPKEDPTVIRDDCGIFVAPSGSDTAAGTKADPVRTLGKGIALARGASKRVYACAASYDEKVVLDTSKDGVAVHGGLACPPGPGDAGRDAGADAASAPDGGDAGVGGDAGPVSPWDYVGTRARVEPSLPAIVLTIRGLLSGTLVEDMEFKSKDAVIKGDSSIAALVDASNGVTLRRVRIVAGNGAAGDPGATGTGGGQPPTPAGNAGTIHGNFATNMDGAGSRLCTCASETTLGARGGDNGLVAGKPGEAGMANGDAGPYPPSPIGTDNGAGGRGRDTSVCGEGNRGAQPPSGATGAGGTASWTLAASGLGPTGAGGHGAAGKIGQGGGGGGGGNRTAVACASCGGGGGGGCGGCGGGGGRGGEPGGSSVGLVFIGSTMEVRESEVLAGNGAAGGVGGAGQNGSAGGNGGAQESALGGNGCRGGDGARGGKGGPGGGGAGGASFAIALKGAPPALTDTALTVGTPGAGGNDGDGVATGAGKGAAGVAAPTQVLP